MNSFFSLSFAAATVLLAVQPAIADPVAIPEPSSTIQLKSMTSEGCYSSSTGLTFNSTYTYQTSGYCQPLCVEMDQSVLALTGGSDCWCGDLIPPASSKVDDSYCDDPCDGYDTEMCGGDSYWTVYLSGTKTNVDNADASSSSASTATTAGGSTTTSMTPSVVTVGGQTIVVTASSQASSVSASAAAANKSSGASKAGIAAGVVVGVVAALGIAGGAYLFLRARKRREIEEEHRRNAAVSSFIGAGKPSSSGGASFTDTRLDAAVMAQRRMSDGSIADNQDYSRRILKVTNA